MTKQIINIGESANDRKGDSLRAAFNKINENFTELYTSSGFTATDRLINGSHEVVLGSTGKLTMPDGLTIADSIIGFNSSNTITEETLGGTISSTTTLENQIDLDSTNSITISNVITQINNDGVVTSTDSTGTILEINSNSGSIKRYVEPDGPGNGEYLQIIVNNGGAIIEGVSENISGNSVGRVTATQGLVDITTMFEGATNSWIFDQVGTLTLPVPTNLNFNDPFLRFGYATSMSTNNWGFGVPGPSAGTVYTATFSNLASMKLLVTVEGRENGGDTYNHTQVCEMLVVRRVGETDNIVDSIVYGVVHTSLAPLAIITAQENVDGRVEILAQPTNSTPIYVKVHATEVVRGD